MELSSRYRQHSTWRPSKRKSWKKCAAKSPKQKMKSLTVSGWMFDRIVISILARKSFAFRGKAYRDVWRHRDRESSESGLWGLLLTRQTKKQKHLKQFFRSAFSMNNRYKHFFLWFSERRFLTSGIGYGFSARDYSPHTFHGPVCLFFRLFKQIISAAHIQTALLLIFPSVLCCFSY